MAYDSPFVYLSKNQLAILATNEKGMYSYFTCLALLQGMLNFYSTNLLLPTISNYELSLNSMNAAIDDTPAQCQGVIKTNKGTALDIVKMASTKENQDEAAMSRVVDNFMAALVTQYTDIRNGAINIQPKANVAGA